MTATLHVRIGEKQKKRLEAMAISSGTSQTQLLNTLVDLAAEHGGVHIDNEVKLNVVIDKEFDRRIKQFPTLAEVERNG